MSRRTQLSPNARYESTTLATPAGEVHVRARGFILQTPWCTLRRLRPVQVVVTRADGRQERAAVDDPGARTMSRLIALGAFVALAAIGIERTWAP